MAPTQTTWKMAAVMALLIAGSTTACGEEPPPPEPVIRPVRSQVVTRAGGIRQRSFSGVAEATTMWNGSFKVAGTLESVPVVVGQSVEQGAIIATIDDYDYVLEVQRAEADLRQARANGRNAEAVFERTKELFEDENATQADYEAARADYEAEREAVFSAEKTLELARRRAGYTTLTAPFSGDIAEVPVDENENVTVGQQIVRMTVGNRRQVSVAIPEAFILNVEQGDPATVGFDAVEGSYPATIIEVGVTSIGMATTFPVTVILDGEAPEVRSGMAADVTFTFVSGSETPGLSVPMVAVLGDLEGNYVFVLDGDSGDLRTARRVSVVVDVDVPIADASGQTRVEIVSGLEEGDVVVTAGARRLADGQQVRLESGR